MNPTRIFENPDKLWEAWLAFRETLKEKAKDWPKVQYVGKNGDKVTDYPVIPYTLEGFKSYCYDNHGHVHQYFDNKDNLYGEYVVICSRIREEIRNQQIIGGMLGFYNPSITQRLNGLVDKTAADDKKEVTFKLIDDTGNSSTETA